MRRSSFIFEENHLFIQEGNSRQTKLMQSRKNKIIDIDGIGNLMDLPKLMLIDKECGNLKVVVDGG